VIDPFSRLTPDFVEERVSGNPLLQPEVAYEWSYGIVYSPKWLKGLTVSADWWHIDLRSLISSLGAQFIIDADLPGLVFRTPPPPGTPPSQMVSQTGAQLHWLSILTKIFLARFSKVSTMRRSIFWIRQSSDMETGAD
jgi:hypothetical protein